MKKTMSLLVAVFAMSLGSASAKNVNDVTQEDLDNLRHRMVQAHNTLVGLSDAQFNQSMESVLVQVRKNDPIAAEKLEAMLESGASKQEILAQYKSKLDSISDNGAFLVGVAICRMIAAVNGGWCFHPGRSGSGGIGMGFFVLLSIITLGEDEEGNDF